ncbi:Stomatal closure-related actin-binding protein, PH domain [Dillenia turbinata]
MRAILVDWLIENDSGVYDYIDSQPVIYIKMRAILVDWLIEVTLVGYNHIEILVGDSNGEDCKIYGKARQVLCNEGNIESREAESVVQHIEDVFFKGPQCICQPLSNPSDENSALVHYIQVVISQVNGQDYSSHSIHVFHVGKMRMKLCKGWITKARESYSTSMQTN